MFVLKGHLKEVCGLKWNNDGKYLASGSNDNRLCIWDTRNPSQPLYTKNEHTAAVKALAWSPVHQNLLASGGGSKD